jgi:hypothetical protein
LLNITRCHVKLPGTNYYFKAISRLNGSKWAKREAWKTLTGG